MSNQMVEIPYRPVTMPCPLCGYSMYEDGDYLQCNGDKQHRLHRTKELARFTFGEKSLLWLKWRMSVRRGKMRQVAHKTG